MIMETVQPSTFTICHIDTPDGKKFLRKVVRENESLDSSQAWCCRAHTGTNWKLEFRRTIKGEIGDPERTVTVMTDVEVRVDYKAGEKQSFSDSKPVYLIGCTGIWLNSYDLPVLCNLLRQKNCRVWVTGHAGSSSSSQHGLSFYDLQVKTSDLGGNVHIGNQTVAVNGRQVISGSVEIK
jgi:hypothetical protein